MWLIDKLAEQRINDEIRKGELRHLPGEGKPLSLDDDSFVPEECRAAFRILKNAGLLPPELNLRKEIFNLDQLLSESIGYDDKKQLNKRMQYLLTQLGMMSPDSPVYCESFYLNKLQART